MLTELSVTNFKSWQHLATMPLSPITGLFGANSSGKTGILQFLLMIKQTIESSDRATVLEFGDDRGLTNLGSFHDMIFAHQERGVFKYSLGWTRDKQLTIENPLASKRDILFRDEHLSFSGSVEDDGADRLVATEFTYGLGNASFTMRRKPESTSEYQLTCNTEEFHFVRTQGRAWPLPPPVKCYGFPDQVYAYYQNAGFLAELQLAFEQLFGGIYYLGPLREFPQRHYAWKGSEPADMGRRGERVVDALLASRRKGNYISPGPRRPRQTLEERIAYWLKKLGLIHEFSVEAIAEGSNLYQVRVQKSPSSPKVLLTDVGFGVSQVLPVLVLCYYVPKGSTVLLEQPEIHLHPSAQSGLADVFIDVMKNRNVQIIVESHSEYLLRRLQRRIAEEELTPEQTSLYFCNMSKDGSKLTPLKLDLFGSIRNWPKDFFGDEFGEMAAITQAAMHRRKEGEE